MAQKVIWSRLAADDLEEIVAYISRDSPAYAANVAQQIVDAVDRLADFPQMGRHVPEFEPDPTIRELIVQKYRVIYRVKPDAVTIGAIVHGARDLANALQDRSI